MRIVQCLAVGVLLCGASLAACSGGGVSTTPLAAPTPVGGASAQIVGLSSATTAPVTGAGTPIPNPGASADFAAMATLLVAAQPVPAGQAGTFGTITSITGSTLVVSQAALFDAADTTGAAPDYQQNYASVGSPGGSVTITLAPNGVIGSANGFADLHVGQTIVAGGTASGSTLSATFIGIFAAAPVTGTSIASRSSSAATSRRSVADAAIPKGWTSQTGALVSSRGIPGVARIPANQISIQSGSYPCFIPGTGNALKTGTATFAISADAAIGAPQATGNYPYRLDSNPTPPAYVSNAGSFTGPGPATDWLQFTALPGPTGAPTYDTLFRFDASLSVTLTESCENIKYTLLGGTVGYGTESSTYDQLPSVNQTSTLKPVKCIDVNIPLHFSIPVLGAAGFNPFGNSQAGLSVCSTPKISGGFVTGTPASIQQATSSGGQFILDPSMMGPASISSAPTFNATAANMSFMLPLQENLTYTDAQTVEYSVYGRCVIGVPICSANASNVGTGAPLLPTTTVTVSEKSPKTISLHAPQYATCSITDPVQQLNNLPPSTNCDVTVRVQSNNPNPINAVITVSNLPQGTYTWNPAAQGNDRPAGTSVCSSSNYAGYYTVTPATATGSSVTFTFMHNAATGTAQSGCIGTITDLNGNVVPWGPNMPIEPTLLVVPSGG